MNLFRKKKISTEKTELERNLRTMDLVLLGLGSMVGTGIFTITGTAAATIAGPALVVSIVIAAIAVGMAALIFAEFASRVPTQGGPYSYLYAVFGEFPAWIAGWLVISEFFSVISLTASGWSSYLKGLFHFELPTLINGPLGSTSGFSIDLLPMLVIAAVTGLVLLNARTVLRFNNILVLLKLLALILFIVVGVFYLNPNHWNDFAPFGMGSLFSGNTGIMAGASLIFLSFLGFETIASSVDEAKNPQRSLPSGIIGALVVTAIFYVLITLVLTGVVSYTQLNVPDAVAYALRSVGAIWAANFVSTIAILTLITVAISMTYALARVLYGISRDGLLPKPLSIVSKKHKVPTNATLITGILSMITAGSVPLEKLSEFLNLCTILYLMMLAVGIIKLRHDFGKPKGREFKAPFIPILPVLFLLIGLSLIIHYPASTWLALAVSLLIAVVIYFAYGARHSKLNNR